MRRLLCSAAAVLMLVVGTATVPAHAATVPRHPEASSSSSKPTGLSAPVSTLRTGAVEASPLRTGAAAKAPRVTSAISVNGVTYSFGWFLYITLDKSYLRKYWRPWMTGISGASALCSKIPVAVARFACTLAFKAYTEYLNTLDEAYRKNWCVETKHSWLNLMMVSWRSFPC